jgi:hypothetical protein
VDGDTAQYALNNKLVDELGTATDVEKALTKQFGWSKADNNYRAISYYDYSVKTPSEQGATIAVIFANGAIMDGEETPGNVGGDTTAAQIRDARLDPKVKAIVLRVNSPGGSVSASEVIREELAAAKPRVNRWWFPWAAWPLPAATGSPRRPIISSPTQAPSPVRLASSASLTPSKIRWIRSASIPMAWRRRRWRTYQPPNRCRLKFSS